MTKRTALVGALFLAAAPKAADARPPIIVDESIPFTADDLTNAVEIRADSTTDIHVTRQGDSLQITVGDQTRIVPIDAAAEPHDLARVVALVIVALDAPIGGPSMAPLPPPAPPAPPAGSMTTATRAPGLTLLGGASTDVPQKNWTLRVNGGVRMFQFWSSWIKSPTLSLSVARRLGPSVHVVAGVDWDKEGLIGIDTKGGLNARLGLELRHRWFAIEGGAVATRVPVCSTTVTPAGPYVAARVHLLPVGAIQNRVFVEVGVDRLTLAVYDMCQADGERPARSWNTIYDQTTFHATAGVEVPL